MKKEVLRSIVTLFAILLLSISFIFLLTNFNSSSLKIQGKVIYYNADNEICNRILNSCKRTEIYKEKDLQLKYKDSNCNKLGIKTIKNICFYIFWPKTNYTSNCKEIFEQCKKRFDYNSYNLSNSKLLCNKINENCIKNIGIYKNFNYVCKSITDNKTKSDCYNEAVIQSNNLKYRCSILKLNCYNKLNLIINKDTAKIEEVFKSIRDYNNELIEENINFSEEDLEEYSTDFYNEMGYQAIIDEKFIAPSTPSTTDESEDQQPEYMDQNANYENTNPSEENSINPSVNTSSDQGINTEPSITSSINITNSKDICNLIINISVRGICFNAIAKEESEDIETKSWCDKIENINARQTCYFATRVQKNTLTNVGSQRDLSLCDNYNDRTLKNLCNKYVNAKTH